MTGGQAWPTVAITTFVALFLCSLSVRVAGQNLAADTQALITFRNVFDPRGTKLNWTNTTSTCSWNGVVCSNDRVTQIRLPGEGLRGPVPTNSLSLLSELRVVSLRNNMLTGPFPGELGNCNHLHALYLGYNDFYGPVPNLTGFWPRLTHLSLQYNRFNGTIPSSIGLFSHLYMLNLRNNSFSGPIPPFNLVNLTLFDVADNNLSGPIPATLTKFGFGAYLGNPNLCGFPLDTVCSSSLAPSPGPISSPQEPGASNGKLLTEGAIIAIIVGGVVLLILFSIMLFICFWRICRGWNGSLVPEGRDSKARDKGKGVEEHGPEDYSSSVAGELERNKLMFFEGKQYSFDLEDLLRASAEVLGKGSAGTAYKAVLEDGTILAVKRLKDVTTGRKEFETQIQLVGRLQHRNLVPLRAFYFSKDEKLLVYDYMPMGSLSVLLHGNRGSTRTPLDWVSRVRIALGAARGLAYLHSQGGSRFAHGNIKSSNILLTKDFDACISDFGLAQLLTSTAAASRIVGYRAPEITETRKVTQISDVYSFGVLLLELLTGKAPSQVSLNDEGIDLPRWVQSVVREEWTAEVFDLELMRYQNIEEEMVAMLQIAMQCVDAVPDRRPKMSDVLHLLEDVHPFSSDTGDEASRRSESVSEDQRSKGSDKDKDSQENTPSHAQTPSQDSPSQNPFEHPATY
ncbi:hypothetical protein M758_11G021900 [Ceratodon purpureus]|nr:hypothetical protein M758_11G021900 [Ceratodon purpureus]